VELTVASYAMARPRQNIISYPRKLVTHTAHQDKSASSYAYSDWTPDYGKTDIYYLSLIG